MKKFLFIIITVILLGQMQDGYADSSFFKYVDDKTTALLNELFVCNIGIMNLQYVGNINAINPIDSDNAIQSVKNTLSEIPAINFTKKVAILKAIDFYNYKNNPNKDAAKVDENLDLIQNELFFTHSQRRIDNKIVTSVFNKLNNDTNLTKIAKLWFENYLNPFYSIVINDKIARTLSDNKRICESNKTSIGMIDYLFYGDIEFIDDVYVINFKIYNRLTNSDIEEFQVISDSENLSQTVREELKAIASKLFNVHYASLEINSDEDCRIFLGDKYLGKTSCTKDFIVPGSYLLTISKPNFHDQTENIMFADFEHKKVFKTVDKQKKLQMVNFYIEPLGSKIFINSVYRGVTPVKVALESGDYMISVKNDVFESIRYSLHIDEPQDEQIDVVFHLKSKNIDNQFKLKKTLYYVSFWNFTFAMIGAIPSVVFAYEYFYRYSQLQVLYMTEMGTNVSLKDTDKYDGRTLFITQNALYAVAAVMLTYTAISLGWMFFSLFDYLHIMEKKDFIPILSFYKNDEGTNVITVGGSLKIKSANKKENITVNGEEK